MEASRDKTILNLEFIRRYMNPFDNTEVSIKNLDTYTRAQAFEDGKLVEVSAMANFDCEGMEVAFTWLVYVAAVVEPSRGRNIMKTAIIDEVLEDITNYVDENGLKPPGDIMPYSLLTTDGEGVEYQLKTWLHFGLSDGGSPTITVLRPQEY